MRVHRPQQWGVVLSVVWVSVVWVSVCAGQVAAVATPPVHTTGGVVSGYVNEWEDDAVWVWQGIPFAAPPTGANRLRPPRALEPWSGVLVANNSGPGCPMGVDPIVRGVEDCLYLDVYTPAGAPTNGSANLQVMVFIHGGGYVVGSDIHGPSKDGNYQRGLYDGSRLAKRHNVIVVAMDYRLSVLGLMALDELRDQDGTSGNYGLQDQQAALLWVRNNIAAFGGNPDNVLLFGESAGAFSICWHLVSPGSDGLFSAALLESGNCDSPSFFRSWERATNFSRGYASAVGCDPAAPDLVDCLQKLPLEQIMDARVLALDAAPSRAARLGGKIPDGTFWPKLAPVMPWGVAIDGSSKGLTGLPRELIQTGKGTKVPVMMGTNLDEGSLFVPMMMVMVPGVVVPLDEHGAHTMLRHFFNESVFDMVQAKYPIGDGPGEYKDYDQIGVAVLTDYFFVCSTRRLLAAMEESAPHLPRFTYRYVYHTNSPLYPIFGNYHSSELKFVFSEPVHDLPFSHKDWDMADTFGWYWTAYARSHNPSIPANATYPEWPVWGSEPANDATLLLDVPPRVEMAVRRDICEFWNTVALDYS